MQFDQLKRREFVTLLGGAASWPFAANAQQRGRMGRIGVLMGYPERDPAAQAQVAAFRQELRRLGWEEGRNVQIDVRFPAADVDRVRTILLELMKLRPDVLVSNTKLVTEVLREEVHTTPIIFIYVGDPVGSGFVRTDAHPDGNLTGFANWDSPAMSGKWLELLKEIAPKVERVGFMMHPENAPLVAFFKSAEAVAPSLKLELVPLRVHDAGEIERSVIAFATERNGGIVVGPHAVTLSNSNLIVALAARLRLPALYPSALFPKAGGLISYGPDPVTEFREGAGYVDRILRGAKPVDLPVQYPTKYELIINLKTATALGLDVPFLMQQRADQLIE
jgi:putative ABC transport system substrate-binding protein